MLFSLIPLWGKLKPELRGRKCPLQCYKMVFMHKHSNSLCPFEVYCIISHFSRYSICSGLESRAGLTVSSHSEHYLASCLKNLEIALVLTGNKLEIWKFNLTDWKFGNSISTYTGTAVDLYSIKPAPKTQNPAACLSYGSFSEDTTAVLFIPPPPDVLSTLMQWESFTCSPPLPGHHLWFSKKHRVLW